MCMWYFQSLDYFVLLCCLLQKVVYITEKKHSRASAGRIMLMSEREKRLAKFSPSDSRVPRIMIPISECPPGMTENKHYKCVINVERVNFLE